MLKSKFYMSFNIVSLKHRRSSSDSYSSSEEERSSQRRKTQEVPDNVTGIIGKNPELDFGSKDSGIILSRKVDHSSLSELPTELLGSIYKFLPETSTHPTSSANSSLEAEPLKPRSEFSLFSKRCRLVAREEFFHQHRSEVGNFIHKLSQLNEKEKPSSLELLKRCEDDYIQKFAEWMRCSDVSESKATKLFEELKEKRLDIYCLCVHCAFEVLKKKSDQESLSEKTEEFMQDLPQKEYKSIKDLTILFFDLFGTLRNLASSYPEGWRENLIRLRFKIICYTEGFVKLNLCGDLDVLVWALKELKNKLRSDRTQTELNELSIWAHDIVLRLLESKGLEESLHLALICPHFPVAILEEILKRSDAAEGASYSARVNAVLDDLDDAISLEDEERRRLKSDLDSYLLAVSNREEEVASEWRGLLRLIGAIYRTPLIKESVRETINNPLIDSNEYGLAHALFRLTNRLDLPEAAQYNIFYNAIGKIYGILQNNRDLRGYTDQLADIFFTEGLSAAQTFSQNEDNTSARQEINRNMFRMFDSLSKLLRF